MLHESNIKNQKVVSKTGTPCTVHLGFIVLHGTFFYAYIHFFCEYQLNLQPDWQQRPCLPWWVGKWVSVREYHREQLEEELKSDVCIFENFCVGEKLRREHEWEINGIYKGLKDAEILARIFWTQNAVLETLIVLNKVNVWGLFRVGAVHFVE